MKHLAAVLGTGQTKYVAKRHDVSMNGLVREAIDRALADSAGNLSEAARRLGISRNTLYRRLRERSRPGVP